MSKWRNTCPDKLLTRIANITEARLYLLRQTGPTGFLIKEHDGETKFKVLLGASHSCDCNYFLRERELCTHILWILIRKFRVPKEDPIAFQLGLCERELNNVLYGNKPDVTAAIKKPNKVSSAGTKQLLKQKQLDKDDVCPICQDEIYKTKKCLSFCKFGCGNSVHVSCIKIWADHQFNSTKEDIIKCPLCRTEFASYKSILEEHRRSKARMMVKKNSAKNRRSCSSCKDVINMSQAMYRCSTCSDICICFKCFFPSKHHGHIVDVRNPRTEKWSRMQNQNFNLCIGGFGANIGAKLLPKINGNTKPSSLSRVRSSSQTDLRDLNLGVNGLAIGPLQSQPTHPIITRRANTRPQKHGRRGLLPPLTKTRRSSLVTNEPICHDDLIVTSSPIVVRREDSGQPT